MKTALKRLGRGVLALVSRKRFSHFTPTEVEAIHVFLLDEFGDD
jgi:hypothetical protein